MELKAICEMSTVDIRGELSINSFTLLDSTLDDAYRKWLVRRCEALEFELKEREVNKPTI